MKKLILSFSIITMCLGAGGAFAQTVSDECNIDKLEDVSQVVHPALVLCTVHAYNAGETVNPGDGAKREQMNEIVRLKSTIVAQQMKRQYDFLDATVRRLETQLRRAALMNQMEAAGAAPANKNTGTTTASGGGISGADDCSGLWNKSEAMQCIQRNATKATQESNPGIAARQLQKDYDVIIGHGPTEDNKTSLKVCDGIAFNPLRDTVRTCATTLGRVANAMQQAEQQRNN
ncbi:MAG: hypothetical protein FWG39_00010 [Alphaproteobacteria bacterium]|nr:hypothetical protein [Alphaproteobacteria bacterium]